MIRSLEEILVVPFLLDVEIIEKVAIWLILIFKHHFKLVSAVVKVDECFLLGIEPALEYLLKEGLERGVIAFPHFIVGLSGIVLGFIFDTNACQTGLHLHST